MFNHLFNGVVLDWNKEVQRRMSAFSAVYCNNLRPINDIALFKAFSKPQRTRTLIVHVYMETNLISASQSKATTAI